MSFEPATSPLQQPVSAASTSSSRRWGCCLVPLFACVLAVLFVLWVVARSGLVSVPVFSSVVYEPQAPLVTVVPSPVPFEQTLTNAIKTTTKGTFNLTIDDATFTRLIQDGLRRFGAPDTLDATHAQIRTLSAEEGVEIYLPFRLTPEAPQNALTVHALPSLSADGNLAFDVREVHVGGVGVPDWLTKFIVDQLESELGNRLKETIGASVAFTKLTLQPGTFALEGKMR